MKRRDEFWLKTQPCFLQDMLADDEVVKEFVGGTVYQASLATKSASSIRCSIGVSVAWSRRSVPASFLDGTRSGAAEHDQHEVLRVGQAVLLEQRPVAAGQRARGGVEVEAEQLVEHVTQ